MKEEKRKSFYIVVCMLVLFVLWTVLICFIDVKTVGPQNSTVGFATINTFVHNLTGVHMTLYNITDLLGLVPLGFITGFALLGLIQLIKRKSILKVDYSILILGGFYIILIAIFVFFEIFIVNYRPVLIDGVLEASYPSSTTMLVMCVMPTTIMQFKTRLKNRILKRCITCVIISFTIFMVTIRLISGVHWFTDIVGGIILSVGLVIMYYYISTPKLK